MLAEQLATVYASSQLPLPRVRYAASHPVCKTFAQLLSAELEALAAAAPPALPTQAAGAAAAAPGTAPGGTAPGTAHAAEPATPSAVASDACPGRSAVPSASGGTKRSGRRGTLLILERSLDPITPLLIDFSLEALGEGLGILRNGRVVPSSRFGGAAVPSAVPSAAPPSLERSSSAAAALGAARTAPGTAPYREVLLLDSDPIWADLRHRPFEEAGEEVRQHLLRFQARHACKCSSRRLSPFPTGEAAPATLPGRACNRGAPAAGRQDDERRDAAGGRAHATRPELPSAP